MSAENPPFVEVTATRGVFPTVRLVYDWLPGQDFKAPELRVAQTEWLFTLHGEGDDQERVAVQISRDSTSEKDNRRTLTTEELGSFALYCLNSDLQDPVITDLVDLAQHALKADMLSLASLSGKIAAKEVQAGNR